VITGVRICNAVVDDFCGGYFTTAVLYITEYVFAGDIKDNGG